MTTAFLRASIDRDRARAEGEIALSLPEDWPDIPDILQTRLHQLEADPAVQPWLLRAMGLRETRTMLGHIGFHAPPGAEYLHAWAPAGVELGFTVFAPFRRKGYAREAVSAMMQWAAREHGATAFVLSIAPGNMASQALAAGFGFQRIGTHLDDVDGDEDVLVLEVSSREDG